MSPPTIRVLHLDDDPDATTLMSLLLREEPGLEEVSALNESSRLLDEVERCAPDVVIVDLTMPGVDAVELIRQVKRRAPQVRVIVFSGYEEPETLERVLAAGAERVIQKGGDIESLMRAIRDP